MIIEIIKTGKILVFFKVHRDMDTLTVEWSDGHISEYDISWLADKRFDKDSQTPHREDIKRTQDYKNHNRLIKSIRFNDVSIYTAYC